MHTSVLRRPIVFLRFRCSILILLIKKCSLQDHSLQHTPLYRRQNCSLQDRSFQHTYSIGDKTVRCRIVRCSIPHSIGDKLFVVTYPTVQETKLFVVAYPTVQDTKRSETHILFSPPKVLILSQFLLQILILFIPYPVIVINYIYANKST